jgi:hypothetical protein
MGSTPMTATTKRLPSLFVAIIALFATLGSVPALAQQEISPEHLDLARKYIELTDRSGLYEGAVVQAGIHTYQRLLPQDPAIAKPLDEAIGVVIQGYRGRKAELFDQFARVYALTFSEEELAQIVAFYESPVGQKLTDANVRINSDIQRVMDIFEGNLRTEFFAKVRAELKAKGIDT